MKESACREADSTLTEGFSKASRRYERREQAPQTVHCGEGRCYLGRMGSDHALYEPRTALVLSGGSARGLAHLGVLSVLQEQGIPLDLLVGASFGGIVAAYFAAGYTLRDIRLRAEEFRLRKVFRIGGGPHVLSAARILDIFRRDLPPRIEQLERPLVVAATDIRNREILFFDRGPLGDALLASSACPGLLPPVPMGEALLVDGGFYNPALIHQARQRGADLVVFSDVCLVSHLCARPWAVALYRRLVERLRGKPAPNLPDRPGLLPTLRAVLQCVGHLQEHPPCTAAPRPYVHLRPVSGEIKPLRFNRVVLGIELGRAEALRRMGEIKDALEGPGGQGPPT